MNNGMNETDPLIIGGKAFHSRLILGTGKFANVTTMLDAVDRSGTQLVTVALRRFSHADDDLYAPLAARTGITLMPNTSGARTAAEAVKAA